MRPNEAITVFGLKDNANSYDTVLANIRPGFGLVFAFMASEYHASTSFGISIKMLFTAIIALS